jgi:type VI secretion system secreted protein Hcp
MDEEKVMKTRNALATILSLVMVAGTLAACPAGYAQTQKAGSRAVRQLPGTNLTDQSDLKPSVAIKMQIPDLPAGQGQDVDVFGYEQETTNTGSFGSGGGGGTGKVVAGPVTVSKRIDGLTPILNKIHVDGAHIRTVTLQWFRLDADGKPGPVFFTITLNDVFISAIHRSLPNQQDPSFSRLAETEAISFTYNDFDVTATGN